MGSTFAKSSVTDVVIDGVRVKDMVGVGINMVLTGNIVIKNCIETNAKNLFANVTGRLELSSPPRGKMWFKNNNLSGDRPLNLVPNPFVLDGKELISITNNIIDESGTTSAGGCKVQDSLKVVVSGNSFYRTYLKPQASVGFIGRSMVINGSIFIS